ncbi:MAG: hypothetical protein GY771_08535 [bacterium]|nr:hypothetical protein [bacterium]
MSRLFKAISVVIVAFAAVFIVSCFETTSPSPSKASNPSPADGATDVSVEADLGWSGGSLAFSGEAGTYTYDLYFGTSTTPPLVASGLTSSTYDPGAMNNAVTYYWRVDTKSGGQTTTGDVWSFTTETGGIIIGTREDHINIPFCGG